MLCAILLFSAIALPGIGVMDFAAEGGASPELASALSTVVGQELEVFKVSNAQTTRVMLGLERQRQLMGCEECTGEALADLMSNDSIVTGEPPDKYKTFHAGLFVTPSASGVSLAGSF